MNNNTMGNVAAVRAAAARRTVLVVEDEQAIRDLLRLHLRNAGYNVILAEDAIAAGRRLLERAGDIDLLIVDAQLPYLSGIEFASTLIADSSLPALPMIVITGHDHLVSRAEGLGVPCLVKPFSAECLVALVDTALASPGASAGMQETRMRRHA
jgi:two-component system, OmpR family, phosphate regulon response regulator PhoB